MQSTLNNQNYYPKPYNPFAMFLEAKDYSKFQSICEAFPHLSSINIPKNYDDSKNVNGVIIRSANDDNVHKAIKYGIWTTTPKNRVKLDQLWHRSQLKQPKQQTYLFFSVVKSGMFEGVARLASGYFQQTFPYWWENHTLKFKGYFKIQWIYIKDINYRHFEGLDNQQGEDVTKSKDCDSLSKEVTQKMLQIFSQRPNKRNIFSDFKHMDQRQLTYTRPLYDQTFEVYNQNQYYQQQQSMGYIMNPNVPQNFQITKPQKQVNLGFQMNPVSKNKKK